MQMTGETPKRIGDILVEKGYITNEQLKTALSIQGSSSRKVGEILLDSAVITEDQLVEAVSERLNIPKINLSSLVINPHVIQIIPVDVAKKHNVLPVFKMGNILTVAMSDPLNFIALDEIKYVTKCVVKRAVAGEKSIGEAIDRYYSVADSVRNILSQDAGLEISGAEPEHTDKEDFVSGGSTVVKLVNLILTRAIADDATDVHIEPDDNELRIRYRVNGIMREEAAPPRKLQAEVVSRIKIASNLDVSEKRIPQDGRMAINVGGRQIDLRVSTLPTIHGEKVVIRILDKKRLKAGLEDLGMRGAVLESWRRHIKTPEGLILLTGPTSSGKTSTLYASLQEINSIEKNIITVEDPVEFSLPLINQVQINEKAGLLFSSALRSILRQNPDIIMVGEIRDAETATIAIRAALTGHLVFSTLHTNDSIATISRLIDMGIDRYLVASALEATLAQRLVRTICPECRAETEISQPVLEQVFPSGVPSRMKFYRGTGCRACRNTGFAGLTGLFELFGVNDKIKDFILDRRSENEIKAEAYKRGYRPLFESGLALVGEGVTTLDEVLKVTATSFVDESFVPAAPVNEAQ